MRIAVGHIIQETNTFSPLLTTLQDFRISHGNELIVQFKGTSTETGGFLDVLSSAGVEIVPMFGADATTGGLLPAKDYQQICTMVAEEFKNAMPVDAVLLALHGAMCAEGVDDIEADLLAMVRNIVGPKIPVAVTLDLHANVTEALVRQAQIIVGYKTWPHIDHFETGASAAQLLLRALSGEITPVTIMHKLPMLLPAENMHTAAGRPLAKVFSEGENWRQRHPEILSISVYAVQPWMDVAEMGCTTMCVVDHNVEVGQRCVRAMAETFWNCREEFDVRLLAPGEAIRKALALEGGPVVLGESSDSPSSGAPGDSAELLRELMALAPNVPAAVWICDPNVVAEAWNIGQGGTIRTRIGGTIDTRNHAPVAIEAVVERLSEGEFTLTGIFRRGLVQKMGRAAVLRLGSIIILVSEKPTGNISADLFRSQQIEPKDQKIIVVKSPGGFRPEYEPFAAAIFMVDTPGIASANLHSLPYTRIPRPIYPLDEVQFPGAHRA
jgi:microcystin degradation protein MlrC